MTAATTNSTSLISDKGITQVLIPPAPSPKSRFASLRHWYSRSEKTSEAAEARLLSRLQFFSIGGKTVATPDESKTIARVGLVDLDGDDLRKINTLVIDQVGNDFVVNDHSIAGSESITDNRLGYSSEPQTEISIQSGTTAIEEVPSTKKNLVMCHGFGAGLGFFYRNYHSLSQVPGWRIYSLDWLGMGRSSRVKFTVKGRNVDESVEEAENFFVDSLEKWRKVQKIEKMTLLGHSLGGYFAAVYALKYPQHVDRLILVSPAGIPPNPYENNKNMKSSGGRTIPGWVIKLWEANITPQLIMRWAGPFGPSLVSQYTTRRFAHLDVQDQIDLHDYLYHISAAPGSGEYALSKILAPGAYARKPLMNRLEGLKMPTVFLYGEEDWMDYRAAEKASSKMRVPTKVIRIPDAGHHLYLDNPVEFDKAVISVMLEVGEN
ncbi:9707_t:CDS:2 [Acaulospora morrowiae]|uniref:9707_t:CDS:1 n=1 Tax=Acaulospora morrowiae TaxID=94023 RepID=A0A9N8WMJ4_9GLOM|nr:9707_t:CDS:2 [Acaulospora morrowiae]